MRIAESLSQFDFLLLRSFKNVGCLPFCSQMDIRRFRSHCLQDHLLVTMLCRIWISMGFESGKGDELAMILE